VTGERPVRAAGASGRREPPVERPRVEHAHKARRTPLVRYGRLTLVVDAREPVHIPSFVERAVGIRDLGVDDELVDVVGEPAGIKLVLQVAVLVAV
jgi:hypothetical protein